MIHSPILISEANMFKDGKHVGYIYKVTNNINGKIYIGQTRQSIERRWSQHITNSKLEQTHSLLDMAIKKYGKDNFTVKCIKEISTETKQELINMLNIKEKEYIIKFNSSYKQGNYNITDGGEKTSPTCLVPVDQYSLDGKYIKTYQGMIDISYDLNISEDCFANISACCNGRKVTAYGYIWRYKGDSFNKYRTEKKTTAVHFPIDIYDMCGNLLYQYDDCQDAIRDNVVCKIQNIRRVCTGERSHYHNMIIRYKGDTFDKFSK